MKFICENCGNEEEYEEAEAHNLYEVFGLPKCFDCGTEMYAEYEQR